MFCKISPVSLIHKNIPCSLTYFGLIPMFPRTHIRPSYFVNIVYSLFENLTYISVKLGDLKQALVSFDKSMDLAKSLEDEAAQNAISKAVEDLKGKLDQGMCLVTFQWTIVVGKFHVIIMKCTLFHSYHVPQRSIIYSRELPPPPVY